MRLQELEREQELGRKLTRQERRKLRRGARRAMSRAMEQGLAEMKREVEQNTAQAADPGLADRLREGGLVAETVFLRFGALPASGPSHSVWGRAEGGDPALAGALTAEGDYVVELPNRWLHADLLRFLKEGRRAFFVKATAFGVGSDGEPLLGKITAVEPVPPGSVIASTPPSRALEEWCDGPRG